MNMHIKNLAKEVDCSTGCLYIYLCRAEFAHITLLNGILKDITEKDIEKFKQLVHR